MRKPVLAADEAAEVAHQRAVRNERALGRPRRAAGVNQHGRVVGLRGKCVENAAFARQQGIPVGVALPLRVAHRHHLAKAGASGPRCQQVGHRRLVGKRHHRLAMVDAVLQRLGAEQHGQRHGHGTELIHRDMCHRCFEALRHQQGDAVAALHAQLHQGVGEAVGVELKVGVAEAAGPAVFMFVVDGHGIWRIARPAGAADLGDVEVLRKLPMEARVQGGMNVAGHELSVDSAVLAACRVSYAGRAWARRQALLRPSPWIRRRPARPHR